MLLGNVAIAAGNVTPPYENPDVNELTVLTNVLF
jgi:hypothetical protein